MQNHTIKVSIICTAFNHERLIHSALDGFVMQQTDFKFEVLVHDDASTDGTAAVIREYAQRYPEIIVPIYQTENQHSKGVRITNDILLPKAKGQYLAFCEGDDFWTDPHKLQKQIDFLDAHPEYTACVHNSVVHDCTGKDPDCLHVIVHDEHDITLNEALKGMAYAYQTSALVMRKEYAYPLPHYYDVASSFGFGDWPRAIWLTQNGPIHFFPEAMSTYRLMSNPSSWSASTHSVKKRLHSLEGNVAMLEAVKAELPDEFAELLNQQILERRFAMLELQERYSEMRKAPYSELWKALSKNRKVKIWIKQLFPWAYHRFKQTGTS